jgi:GDP-mannose transporter
VPTYSVFKNLSILISAYGEYKLFDRKANKLEIFSYFLIIIGSLLSGSTDLSFELTGFLFMVFSLLSITTSSLGVKYLKTKIILTDDEIIIYQAMYSLPIYLLFGSF